MQGTERSLVDIIKMAYFGRPLELLTTEEFEELRQWVEHHWPINHFANWQYGDKSPEEIQAVITSVTTLIPDNSNDIHPKDVVVKVYGRYEEELARRVYEAEYPSTVDEVSDGLPEPPHENWLTLKEAKAKFKNMPEATLRASATSKTKPVRTHKMGKNKLYWRPDIDDRFDVDKYPRA